MQIYANVTLSMSGTERCGTDGYQILLTWALNIFYFLPKPEASKRFYLPKTTFKKVVYNLT